MSIREVPAISGIHLLMADGSSFKPSSDEKHLLRRISQGETERFADLISRYQPHVTRIVGRRVPADQVKEVVHDVFVRAYFSLAHFSESVAFDHWLAGIAVRTCYDFWRAKKRDEVPVSVLADGHHRWIEQMLAAQSEDQFRDQVQKREAAEVLEWALKQLSPENRAVLTLVHLEGRSVREAAQLLGWSVINVKVRTHRARQAVRKLLAGG
ncbi:MAG TPA: RNA polymerase sigma factor [Nitrospira sp.]|nr:RNA polymerase sigma factor [Nitrospira sp.]